MFTAAGKSAAASAANYIEDVFSTYLYTGNASTQTITNGIDLAGKGGLVWTKERSGGASAGATNHALVDTVRGAIKNLRSNTTGAEFDAATGVTAFNNNGYSIGAGGPSYNESSGNYASWTFRKQAKFFDVVTYTGDGTSVRSISHNLGSTPGFIIIKATSAAGDWSCYHRSLGVAGGYIRLNNTSAAGGTAFATPIDSTVFSIENSAPSSMNTNGVTYVAYLFAHNAGGFGAAGTDNVISCGSYTGNGSATGPVINLGYEPQWVLVKNATSAGYNWYITDTMRGFTVTTDSYLAANLADAELTTFDLIDPTSTGFAIKGTNANYNQNSATYIYIAIRRGPMRTPTSGTSVYEPVTYTGNNANNRTVGTLTSPDLGFDFYQVAPTDTFAGVFFDRLRGPSNLLYAARTDAEVANTVTNNFPMNGASISFSSSTQTNSSSYNYGLSLFRRAPGFFDVVCYTGTGVNRTANHNLGVVPELMIIKERNLAGRNWGVYSATLGNTKYLFLSTTNAEQVGSTLWNNTSPTASVFTVGTSSTVNLSASTYVAYLFATCPNVSKVGSYTGTGALQTINCGFASGARFVLIKRTDLDGDWWMYDSARGITSGNDPYYLVNTGQNITSTNYVDTASTGFQVTAAAPAGLNAVGGNYIFLAIA